MNTAESDKRLSRGTIEEDISHVIKCFGRITLTRLPHGNEPSDKIMATVTLSNRMGPKSPRPEIGLLYLWDNDLTLNQLFNVEIHLTPISEEEGERILELRPVLI